MSGFFQLRGARQPVWVRSAQLILLAAGLAVLGYVGLTLGSAYYYQRIEGRKFDQTVLNRRMDRAAGSPIAGSVHNSSSNSLAASSAPARDGAIARIEIPRVGLSALVLEGDEASVLRLGPGHIPGTAKPGEAGNVGIAGHRDTFFRPLRNLKRDDTIIVRTPAATYRYQVESLQIVAPNDIAVLRPTVHNTLTLVTCYPFYFVGAAPERFIVRARQLPEVKADPAKAQGVAGTGEREKAGNIHV